MSVVWRSFAPQSDFGRGPHWLHESPFLPILWEETQDLGAPSLKHAAMKIVLMDQSMLTPKLFAQVPWRIAEYLWGCLGRCNKQTLHMWMIMAKVYPHHFRQLSPSYSLHVEEPREPLKLYIDIMHSDPRKWSGILSLSTAYATITDLVAIGNMTNLVALEISNSPRDMNARGHGLDDRIVRSWVETATSVGSLQQLRVLRVSYQPDLTIQAFRMLEELPQLELVVIYHCNAIRNKLDQYPQWKDKGVRVEGWMAQRMDWIMGDEDAEALALDRLLPLLDVPRHTMSAEGTQSHEDLGQGHKSCKQLVEKHGPFSQWSGSPFMHFELSPGPFARCSLDQVWIVRERYDIVFFTRTPSREKKRAPSERAPSESVQTRKGKRVMKDRGGREIADVLGDFL